MYGRQQQLLYIQPSYCNVFNNFLYKFSVLLADDFLINFSY